MNMDCKSTATLLVQHADGELSSEQAARLEEHLLSCAECGRQRRRFLMLDSALAAYGELACEEGAQAAARAERPGARFRLSWALAFAVALMAAAVIWLPWIQPPPAEKPRVPPQQQREADARFVPVPYVPPLAPYESARVVRMEIPVAALLAAGYRVQLADPAAIVAADVLVGEDGRVHAIRFSDGTPN